MRLELAGSLIHPEPVVLKFTANQALDIQSYRGLGYTHFDVICIGAGGGTGGGVDTLNTGTKVRNRGGAGGGGGFHRVHGLLSALPNSCPIVVGAGGAPGVDDTTPQFTTNGADGGASSFNTTTCRASGGKGGKRAQSNSLTVTTQADGGEGGIGNRALVGGGGSGGLAGTPSATGPGTPGVNGVDGTLTGNIGKGGGGGAGGVTRYDTSALCNAATAGGKGSFNPGNTAVYGPGGDPDYGTAGGASGAKAAPLNGLPTVYGKSQRGLYAGDPGVVIIRLTAE